MRRFVWFGLGLVVLAAGAYLFSSRPTVEKPAQQPMKYEPWTVELTDYNPPPPPPQELFEDDELASKHPQFDPQVVDSRLEEGWRINLSAAVIKLNVPMILPDHEGDLLKLAPSYAQAIKNYQSKNPHGYKVLPSLNMIDGKAKQFDDGLYAAIDQAYFDGIDKVLTGHLTLIRKIYDQLDPKSAAAAYLAADLELADIKVANPQRELIDQLIRGFESDQVLSKPTGFYTWNQKLRKLFRVLRFLQQPLDPEVVDGIGAVFKKDPATKADYVKAVAFFERLSNPRNGPSIVDKIDNAQSPTPAFFFPGATSKEAELFETLFPSGLPPDADLMKELVATIRSGKVNLAPKPNSGWYDYQVYALETLLLPEKGAEREKLLLTKSYKKRMLEAFQALITKRKETQNRYVMSADAYSDAAPLEKLKPRLRLEPAPTYYLRTARAYDFLARFLESSLGTTTLKSLHGLKADGSRSLDLATELAQMRELFYGCYLLSAEDIGMKAEFLKDEKVDIALCTKFASEWLEKATSDPDLAADTRVTVPVYRSIPDKTVRCWGTIGVRLAKLQVDYVTPPSIQPANGGGDWKPIETDKLEGVTYLIPVDEFAEFTLKGLRVLTREELRAVCDEQGTKEKIIPALSR